MMKNQRLQQFAASFLIVLSLFVSSVSAVCACSHAATSGEHCQNSVETETQNHAAHKMPEADAQNCHKQISLAEIFSIAKSECCCAVQTVPRAIAKAENVKIEKQQTAVLTAALIEFVLIRQTISVETVDFVTPFYLSDSFHNLTPGRAPPCL